MSTCSDTNYSFFISSIGFDFVELWTPTSTSTELQTQLQLQQLQQLSNSYICSDIITSSTNNNETSSETSSQKSSTGNNDNCTISKKVSRKTTVTMRVVTTAAVKTIHYVTIPRTILVILCIILKLSVSSLCTVICHHN